MTELDGYIRTEYEDDTTATATATTYEPMVHLTPCKIQGCEEVRADRAGIYGGLCLRHKDAKKKDRSEASATAVPKVAKSELAELALSVDTLLTEIEEKSRRLGELLAAFDEKVQARIGRA